ncbi:hypothetical protein LOK74_05770 [Brevibacillus humidisoli]|uniref:hypothetical protein n=1 Tax=Brevibacillus humidisoli TaxID=2895522 RepID=UPI001E614524|nr:hypothetical protein [Brevibacillus humidisoli]UFJ42005.1 hypothetical protein LOK74_05770 [Brevibacillus humidisoli]
MRQNGLNLLTGCLRGLLWGVRPEANEKVEISFEVEAIESVYARWQEKGVALSTELIDFPLGRKFMARDPEGQTLVVYEVKK